MKENNLCLVCPKHIRGKCCYFATEIGDFRVILSNHPCKFLNISKMECKHYENRKEINPNCLTVEEMIAIGSLPKECLYVKDIDYKPKRIYNIPFNKMTKKQKKEYNYINNLSHSEIGVYHIQRSVICPNCESIDIDEECFGDYTDNLLSINKFIYQCHNCKHEWEFTND